MMKLVLTLLKKCFDELCDPLKYIFNLSLEK